MADGYRRWRPPRFRCHINGGRSPIEITGHRPQMTEYGAFLEQDYLLKVHVLPVWRDREFTSIRRSDVAALLDRIEDNNGSTTADYVLGVVRSIMNWFATRHDYYNPPIVRGMKRRKSVARERVLDDGELRAICRVPRRRAAI
jgi:hypothetical protein